MKLSTRIKRYVEPECYEGKSIKLVVDCGKNGEVVIANTLEEADRIHNEFIDKGYSLLPPNECPVVNDNEIVMHYTSTNYRDWCEG